MICWYVMFTGPEIPETRMLGKKESEPHVVVVQQVNAVLVTAKICTWVPPVSWFRGLMSKTCAYSKLLKRPVPGYLARPPALAGLLGSTEHFVLPAGSFATPQPT